MKNKVHHYDLLEQMIYSRDKQLIIQAKEYKRRLKVLNGEGERIKEILKETIPREVFDRTISSMNEKRDSAFSEMNDRNNRVVQELRDDIKDLADYKTKQEGKSQLTRFIPWVIAASALAYEIFKK